MEQTIRNMINQAETEENYSLIEYAKQIVDELATTINAPSNWRDIGEKLADEYNSDSWVYENMELWNYIDIDQGDLNMENREIALVLLNMQLDMDYADTKQYGKMETDKLEEEISTLRQKDSSLFYILENIAMQNDNITFLVDGTEEE